MSGELFWRFVENDGRESLEYALDASGSHYVLIAWADKTWATLFDRQPSGDVELADFVVRGRDDIAGALERVGIPGDDASRIGSEVWDDVESRRRNRDPWWSRLRTRLRALWRHS